MFVTLTTYKPKKTGSVCEMQGPIGQGLILSIFSFVFRVGRKSFSFWCKKVMTSHQESLNPFLPVLLRFCPLKSTVKVLKRKKSRDVNINGKVYDFLVVSMGIYRHGKSDLDLSSKYNFVRYINFFLYSMERKTQETKQLFQQRDEMTNCPPLDMTTEKYCFCFGHKVLTKKS